MNDATGSSGMVRGAVSKTIVEALRMAPSERNGETAPIGVRGASSSSNGGDGAHSNQETFLILTISHRKDLPNLATDVISQRAYSWLFSQGVEAGVTATLLEVKEKR